LTSRFSDHRVRRNTERGDLCLGSLWRANLGTLDGEFGAFERLADRLQSDGGLVIDELNLTAEESLLD
jgi:hypothetical protein